MTEINKTLLEIIASREDISDYLFHFTKGKNAFQTLCEIWNERSLKDPCKRGYICFTEAPITALYNMFQIFERYDEPMYAPYGIGIKKDLLYEKGCRPVIYGTNDDFKNLPQEFGWRCVEYLPYKNDYTWLREWRLKQSSFELLPKECIIITKTESEQTMLMKDTGDDLDFDGDIDDGELHGCVTGQFLRIFRGISMEDIKNVCKYSKNELEQILSSQKTGDVETRMLGYF